MTANRTIGGRLDHRALAMLHRPTDPALLRREAVKLLALGLSLEDAAHALQIPAPALWQLLGDYDTASHQPDECSPCPGAGNLLALENGQVPVIGAAWTDRAERPRRILLALEP